jgi:uncharacterized protein (DUF488 family)
MASDMATILTIGHSAHTYEEFLRLLRGAGVTAVADVRSSPFSRHQPQFNKNDLQRELRLDKIDYVFLGNELALQLRLMKGSESMGNHDSTIVDACGVD